MSNYKNTYNLPASQRLMTFDRPIVMGIININKDSFYSGSRYTEATDVVDRVSMMIAEGADIIDLGGMSSRPGATEIPLSEELDRLLPVLAELRAAHPELPISIDTYRSAVVRACHDIGIDMVNDISAGHMDPEMIDTVAELRLPYIMMHMRGNPKIMQQDTSYDNIILDILSDLSGQVAKAKVAGVHDLIIDPGIGFGKTVEDNYRLIKHLSTFKILELPILIGLSRKSFIYKSLSTDADHALNGTTAMHMLSLMNGAQMLRVHDVREAHECRVLYQKYLQV